MRVVRASRAALFLALPAKLGFPVPMKPIVLEYDLARQEFVTGLMAIFARLSAGDTYRPWMNVARLAGLILLFIVWPALGWSAYSLLAAVIVIPLGEAAVQQFIGRRAIGSTFDPAESAIRLEISEDGLHERTANRERRYLWSGVRNVFETGDVIVFDLAGTDMVVVPDRAITSLQRAELEQALANRGKVIAPRSQADTKAGVRLGEIRLLAKLSVSMALFGIIVSRISSANLLVPAGPVPTVGRLLFASLIGLIAAVGGWLATGALLKAVARYGESRTSAAAWTMIILAIGVFVFAVP